MTPEFSNKTCAEPVNLRELMKTLHAVKTRRTKPEKQAAIFRNEAAADALFKIFGMSRVHK